MARIMVDEIDQKSPDKMEFAFRNLDGDVEFVYVKKDMAHIASIKFAGAHEVEVYFQDIPMLIKALQAVYNFKQQGEKI
jgi:hypothetical protein